MKRLAQLLRQVFCMPHSWGGDWSIVVPKGCSVFRCRKCDARKVIYGP